jgi:hypothetical protein
MEIGMAQGPGDDVDLDIHAADAYERGPCIWSRLRERDGLVHSPRHGGFYVAARSLDRARALPCRRPAASAAFTSRPRSTRRFMANIVR